MRGCMRWAVSLIGSGSGRRCRRRSRGPASVPRCMMLTAGGEACSDIDFLVPQQRLFGAVASDSTLYRTMRAITPTVLADLTLQAAVDTRSGVAWDGRDDRDRHCGVGHRRVAGPDPLGEQARDGPELQGRVRVPSVVGLVLVLNPNCRFLLRGRDRRSTLGDVASGERRSEHAGRSLHGARRCGRPVPVEIAAGHHAGDDTDKVGRAVQVRTDSAGCSTRFAAGCRSRNIGFAVVARSNASIHKGISRIRHDESRWLPARRRTGDSAQRSHVAEITDLVDLSRWPAGTRMIVRREHLHEGAQRSLFPSLCYRSWGHYTDAARTDKHHDRSPGARDRLDRRPEHAVHLVTTHGRGDQRSTSADPARRGSHSVLYNLPGRLHRDSHHKLLHRSQHHSPARQLPRLEAVRHSSRPVGAARSATNDRRESR